MTTLREALQGRIGRASLQSLAAAEFLAVDPIILAAETGDAGDAEACASDLVRALAVKNQFVASDPAVSKGVRDETRALWQALAAGAPRAEALGRARQRLAAILASALGAQPREIVSAEYSPELQLAVLGLTAKTMLEPILDVGCGENAALVRHLRAAHKDARGLDPNAPAELGDRGDWLTFDFGAARYGTIVSHLAFSLHFMHQEMQRRELAFEYARAYMRIARGLKVGGMFAYVPGLPFIEALLSASDFAVAHVPLPESHLTPQVLTVQHDTGLVLDTATHVRRIR